jgi:nucleotide-binding universal stress UspA family protein
MFTRIVVPLDGSHVASRALGYAIAFAEKFNAALTLIGVIVPTLSEMYSGAVFGVTSTALHEASGQASDPAEKNITAYLESVAAPLRARGMTCEIAIHHGNPAAEIITCAGDAPGTLIAMSTHGRTGFQRWRLGSVAQHVMRYAAVPTLIVVARGDDLPDASHTVAEITVTLDGSLLAETALPAATALADTFGAPLNLLMVLANLVSPPSHDETEFMASTDEEERANEEGAEQYLAHVVARTTTPTRTVRSVSRRGTAMRLEDDIRTYLAERPAGIVVMASHGRGGILRWAIGSTAEGMIVQSPQPVLIIRAGTATQETMTMTDAPTAASIDGPA